MKIPYTIQIGKRIQQNLHDVNFEDDFDVNEEYLPAYTEKEILENDDEETIRLRLKRGKKKVNLRKFVSFMI